MNPTDGVAGVINRLRLDDPITLRLSPQGLAPPKTRPVAGIFPFTARSSHSARPRGRAGALVSCGRSARASSESPPLVTSTIFAALPPDFIAFRRATRGPRLTEGALDAQMMTLGRGSAALTVRLLDHPSA